VRANKLNFSIVTGTGRCGTQFIARLLARSGGVITRHDPNPLNLTFHRYAKWYNLPIDEENFFNTKLNEIEEDLKNGRLSVHSSAHMAFSIEALNKRFACKIVILYRHPADVVNSYLGKGYYLEHYHWSDVSNAIGYQDIGKAPHHFFGRIIPNDSFFSDWQKLTRTGKIAWMWSAVNREIGRQLADIPESRVFVSKIEDFDYERYIGLCSFMDIQPVGEAVFNDLRGSRVNTLSTSAINSTLNWSVAERSEFTEQAQGMAQLLGYDVSPAYFTRPDEKIPSDFSKRVSTMDKIKRIFKSGS
jgi:hypothetical protein